MTKSLRRWLIMVFFVAISGTFIAGCATTTSYGTRFDPDKIAQIKKSVTTLAQVEALFGQPGNAMTMLDGRRAIAFTFVGTSQVQTPKSYLLSPFIYETENQSTIQTLTIVVNKADIVDDYTFTDNTRNVKISTDNLSNSTKITDIPADQKKK